MELDSLHAAIKPRKGRMSVCLPNLFPSPIEAPSHQNNDKRNETGYLWVDPTPNRLDKTPPKVYINLPKLPFGRHESCNSMADIRSFFVSHPARAWRRKTITKPKKLKRRLNVTLFE